jgi:hypothetical protein
MGVATFLSGPADCFDVVPVEQANLRERLPLER